MRCGGRTDVISRLWSSSLLLISRWAIQVPVSRGSATRSPLQWPMACSISASSRPMLRTIASVLSRGLAWGGFCMASTLLAKTVCPAPDQLGHRKGLTRLWAHRHKPELPAEPVWAHPQEQTPGFCQWIAQAWRSMLDQLTL